MQPKLRTSGCISILEILGCEERFPLWTESDISLIASLVECLFFSSGTLLEEAVEPVGDVACLTEADLWSFTCLTGSGLHSVPRLSALCGLPYFPCQNEPASLPSAFSLWNVRQSKSFLSEVLSVTKFHRAVVRLHHVLEYSNTQVCRPGTGVGAENWCFNPQTGSRDTILLKPLSLPHPMTHLLQQGLKS